MGLFDWLKKQPKQNNNSEVAQNSDAPSKQTNDFGLPPEKAAAIKAEVFKALQQKQHSEAIQLASDLSANGNYPEAIISFMEIIRLAPSERGFCENEIGAAYLLMGENKLAITHYLLALEHGFDHAKTDDNVWEAAEESYNTTGDAALVKIYLQEFPQGKNVSKAKQI